MNSRPKALFPASRKPLKKALTPLAIVPLAVLASAELANANELEPEFNARTRFHQIKDNNLGDAQAFTTRLAPGLTWYLDDKRNWQLFAKANIVVAANKNGYNSMAVARPTAPIADPANQSLLQWHAKYDSQNYWSIAIGRQKLDFNNQRIIGSHDFWQTPQTFDAASFHYDNYQNFKINYHYTSKVHRIFSRRAKAQLSRNDVRFPAQTTRPANQLGVHRLDGHLLNVEYQWQDLLNISAYNYWVDNEDFARFSINTQGLILSGEAKPARIKYFYRLHYAKQRDIEANPLDYSADYHELNLGFQYKSHRFEFTQEVFSAANNAGFITPLASFHNFQGWTDVFSSYGMQQGLKEQNISYRGRHKKLRWRVRFHNFNSYVGDQHIGTEIDLELAYRFNRHWQARLVYARFNSIDGLTSFNRANDDVSTTFGSISYKF